MTEFKEMLDLLFHGKFRALLIEPTRNDCIYMLRYLIVGGISLLVDVGLVWILDPPMSRLFSRFTDEQYGSYTAVFIAYVAGMVVNFLLSRFFVFNGRERMVRSAKAETAFYVFMIVVGLLLTELIVWLGDSVFSWSTLLSKWVSVLIVFLWNYLARRLILFRKPNRSIESPKQRAERKKREAQTASAASPVSDAAAPSDTDTGSSEN